MVDKASDAYYDVLFTRPQVLPDGRVIPGLWNRWDAEPAQPTKTSKHEVAARIEHGRWLVDCPCGGAQLTRPGEERFFCVDCLNEYAGGAWVRVRFPRQWRQYEEALDVRPKANRNWSEPEALGDLRTENAAYGVG